jgi:hypothetical protein
MQKKVRFFLGGIFLCLFVAGVWFYGLFSEKHQSAKDLKAEITINSFDLYKLYAQDESAADKLFLNKIIRVKGRISQIIASGSTKIYLLKKNISGGINCQMSGDGKDNLPIPADSTITIKGRCTGFLMDVNLVDCVRE